MAKKHFKASVVSFYALMLVIGFLGGVAAFTMKSGETWDSFSIRSYQKIKLGRGFVIVFSTSLAIVGAFGLWGSLRGKN